MIKTSKKITARRFTTGVGLAKFPHLIVVDPDDEYGGDYTVKLLLAIESDECKALEAFITQCREEFRPLMAEQLGVTAEELEEQQVNWPVVIDRDKEQEETGYKAFLCKSKGSYKRDGKTIDRPQPDFYDAVGNKIPNPQAVFGPTLPYNSEIALCLSVSPYHRRAKNIGYGVTPYITAVQVIEVASSGPADAEACGFGKHDGGYTSADKPFATQGANPEDVPF